MTEDALVFGGVGSVADAHSIAQRAQGDFGSPFALITLGALANLFAVGVLNNVDGFTQISGGADQRFDIDIAHAQTGVDFP